MATTIKLKNGSGAPLAGDLVQGEPAFDLTNKRLYTEDSGGTVIEVGTTPTSLTTTGTVTFGSLSDGAITITAFVDEDNMVSDSATLVPTQQSVKAYVDSQVTAQDLDFQGDSGGALSIDLDSETLTIVGGTGIDTTGATNTLTVAIDSTVTTLTGTQTLTNKTLTSPVINTGVSGTAVLDDDTFATASATTLATSESIKAYVDAQVDTADQLSELSDVNITTPADGALLFYDTTTTKWIDNDVSGDITIADTGVAAISSGVIVNADVNASAAISVSKTALTAGTGLTLTTDTLSVDASQTQITAVGTIGTGTWQGTAVADAYVADNLTISGGTVDNTVIGGTTAAAGTFTTFTSTGIDDNATSTAITIDSSENVGIGTASPNALVEAQENVTDTYSASASSAPNVHLQISNEDTTTANTMALVGFGSRGTTTTTSQWYIGNVGMNNAYADSSFVFGHRTAGSTWSEVMRLDGSGNVGIGTTSPDYALEIEGSAKEFRITDTGANNTYASVSAQPNNAQVIVARQGANKSRAELRALGNRAYLELEGLADDVAVLESESNGDLTISLDDGVTDTEFMRFDASSGNVGIGTTSPTTKLHIEGNTNGLLASKVSNTNTGASARADFTCVSDSADITMIATSAAYTGVSGWADSGIISTSSSTSGGMLFNVQASAPYRFMQGATNERMRIDSSGNLLVGRTSNDAGYAHQFQSGTSDVTLNAYRPNTSASSSIALFNSDVGGAFSVVCAIRCDGDLENTNNSYGALSDERLKSNIVDASSQIDDIMAVQVRSYTLNKTGDTHIGVVAQELEASGMSGLVQENEEGMKSVKYSVLYMKAIKALQEAVTRIETLEAEVAALKGA